MPSGSGGSKLTVAWVMLSIAEDCLIRTMMTALVSSAMTLASWPLRMLSWTLISSSLIWPSSRLSMSWAGSMAGRMPPQYSGSLPSMRKNTSVLGGMPGIS